MSFEITLSQAELDKAIKNHVKTLGFNTEGKVITAVLTSTRKPVGYSALVTIADTKALAEVAPTAPAVCEGTLANRAEHTRVYDVTPQATFAKQVDDVELPPVTFEATGGETKAVPASLFGE